MTSFDQGGENMAEVTWPSPTPHAIKPLRSTYFTLILLWLMRERMRKKELKRERKNKKTGFYRECEKKNRKKRSDIKSNNVKK